MSIIQAIVLGIIQGLTEFIPVSSSGHLLLVHQLFALESGGLLFDVSLHMGTLLALVIFFYNDILKLAIGLVRKTENTKMAWLLVLATIPAVVAGILFQDLAETTFRSAKLVAFNLMVFGMIMLIAEKYASKHSKKSKTVDNNQAVVLGFAQAIAIIPGVSRSGSTITAGLFVGLDRITALRFSFLLAIPVTFGAILKVVANGAAINGIGGQAGIIISGVIAAFLSGGFAIKFLLNYLSKNGLEAFAYYRIMLGAVILFVLFAR